MKKHLRRLLAAACACALLLTAASALTVDEAIGLLETYYVDDLPAEAYEAQDLDELFLILGDPYTYYMTAEQYEEFNAVVEDTTSVVGIGVQVTYTEEGIHIIQVVNGGPAEAAGLVAGDLIIAIGDESCVPASEASADLMRGEAGTSVTVTVRHADGSQEDYTLTRAQVVIENTNVSVADGHVGIIDCDSFGSTTADLFRAGIEAHEDEVSLWWVDLRDNAGGMASTAVESIGMFTGGGIHLYYRDGADNYLVSLTNEAYITDHPVIVLTNARTASAAELFAADVRDSLAGISLGGRTYGKGVAQIVLDGNNEADYFTDDAMKVTGYRFYSAATNTTDKIGVIPTLLVADEDTEAVATLLSGQLPADAESTEGWLKVNLCGWDYYIDLSKAQSDEWSDAFDALLEALPPDAAVFAGVGNDWSQVPVNVAITLYGGNVESRWFTDVDTSLYKNALNVLATYGILQGNGDGTFNPEGTLTRAQLCALLAQALGVTSLSESPYSDVEDTRWYAPYVTAMSYMGLVEGYEDGTFRPNDTVTNEQFMVIMARLATFLNASLYDISKEFTEEQLTDASLDGYADWAKEAACLMTYVQELAPNGALAIFYDDLEDVDPDAAVLREQAGATLYNLLDGTGILRY